MNKIKETYLLMLIVIGLISLSLYSTYALFTASTEINDVVSFEASLTTNSNILEYEMVTVPVGEMKIIELNISNNYGSNLYYGAWYEIISPNASSNISVGLYTEKNSNPSSGQLASGANISLLVGISNDSAEDAIVNIGTVGSLTSNLNLSENRILIPTGWSSEILVTDEYLEEHSTIENAVSEYTEPGKIETTLSAGAHLLEVWGAQGGNYNGSSGGKGGYSYGTLTLTEDTKIYIYVGGQGRNSSTAGSFVAGGFNGGGAAGYRYGGSGGGASDIRIGTDSLYARVIVAGGGGGSWGYEYYNGGNGGGTSGYIGTGYQSSNIAGAGTQTSGGAGIGNGSTNKGSNGTFGLGGAGSTNSYDYNYSSGGGGGWYGGGGTGYRTNAVFYYQGGSGGGGGSGWVYTSDTATYTNSSYTGGTWLLNSNYYLTNAATIGKTITDFDGTTVSGHSGDGAVRISGSKKVYSIPKINGLDDLTIIKDTSVNLTEGVTIECEFGKTGCSLTNVSITDTSTLEPGEYTIYYSVANSSGKVYKYARSLTVTNPYLNTYSPGAYVKYVGNNGCNNGTAGTTGTGDAESGNSCLGYNANQTSTSGTTYGYCSNSSYKFSAYGWRIAYIENGYVYLTTAGSPECIARSYEESAPEEGFNVSLTYSNYQLGKSYSFDSSTGLFSLSTSIIGSLNDGSLETHFRNGGYEYSCFDGTSTSCETLYQITSINGMNASVNIRYNTSLQNTTHRALLNTKALDYCNSSYVAGGVCSSTTAWAMGDTDFYKITGYHLTKAYDESNYCTDNDCSGFNDLINNGGYYYFDAYEYPYYVGASVEAIFWEQQNINVDSLATNNSYGFRPIIKLSSSVYVTGGTGTMTDPYIIGI